MKKKRGILTQQFALIVIVVAAAVVLFSATIGFTNIFKTQSDIEVCRLSVLAQDKTKFVGRSVVGLDCPRRHLEFFESKVEVDGKKVKGYNFDELNEDIVNKVIAEELSSCWYKMGEGKINVFEDSFVETNNICLICTEIEFDDNIKESNFKNLGNFLKTNKINPEQTYFEYLIREQSNRYLLWGAIPWSQWLPWMYGTTNNIDKNFEDKGLETSKSYVIYFLVWKPLWISTKIGTFTPAYYIGLGEPSKLTQECNLLVN